MSHSHVGSDRTSLLKIYHALIKPKLDYCSSIYNSANKHILKSLNPIHYSAIKLSIGVFPTTPITSILCEANELFFEFDRNLSTLKTLVCLRSNRHMLTHFLSSHNSNFFKIISIYFELPKHQFSFNFFPHSFTSSPLNISQPYHWSQSLSMTKANHWCSFLYSPLTIQFFLILSDSLLSF